MVEIGCEYIFNWKIIDGNESEDDREILLNNSGIDTTYGLHGYAKEMKDENGDTICIGGAEQYNTALSERSLRNLGIEY